MAGRSVKLLTSRFAARLSLGQTFTLWKSRIGFGFRTEHQISLNSYKFESIHQGFSHHELEALREGCREAPGIGLIGSLVSSRRCHCETCRKSASESDPRMDKTANRRH